MKRLFLVFVILAIGLNAFAYDTTFQPSTPSVEISSDSDAVDVSEDNIVFVDTSGGNVTIGGLSGGVTPGHTVRIIKTDAANNMIVEHNEAAGTEKIFLPNESDETYDTIGGLIVTYDGTYWVAHASTFLIDAATVTLDDAYNNDTGERTITVDDGDVSWDIDDDNSFIVDLLAVDNSGDLDGFLIQGYSSTFFNVVPANTEVSAQAPLVVSSDLDGMYIDATSEITLDAVDSSYFTVSGATADLTLGARGSSVALNESGETTLDTTSQSLIGATNEVRAVATIGSPVVDTVHEMISCGFSAGVENDTPISDAGGATIDIDAGEGFLRTSDSNTAPMVVTTWAANNGVAIPTDTVRYIGIEYNAGSPQSVVRTSDSWNGHDEFRTGSVVNEGGTLHIVNNPQVACDSDYEVFHRLYETRPMERAERLGGLINSETGTRNLYVTAGELYDGLKEFEISTFDSSAADTFDLYYRDGVGGYTKVASQTAWSNTQYDDNSGTLATLSNNYYAVHWVYLELDDAVVVLYSQGQYANLGAADLSTPPASVPLRTGSHGKLIGRIIQGEGNTNASSVESVFTTTFGASGATNHNDLGGLQGGAAGLYYHSDQDINTTASPEWAGTTLTDVLDISGGGLSTNWVTNALSMGHDSSGHTSWIQSGDTGGTTLELNPQGGLTVVGTTGSGSHGLGSGDLYCGGGAEFDSAVYVDSTFTANQIFVLSDSTIQVSANSYGAIIMRNSFQTRDSAFITTGSAANAYIMCEYGDRTINFDSPQYTDPTLRIQSSDATNTSQYVATQHNQVDAKEIIGSGSKVTEHVTPVELADDGSFDLPDASSGFGTFYVIDAEEFAMISWESSGAVTIITSNGAVVATDTDTNLCFFDNGTATRVRNRLGSAKDVIFDYNYTTP